MSSGSGALRRAAVLGHPIEHSKSPALQGAAWRFLSVDVDYGAIDTPLEELSTVLSRVRSEPGWVGLSITMPLKAAAAEAVDSLDERAQALNVINTVTVSATGSDVILAGHNTDVDGIVNAVRDAAGPAGLPSQLRAAILGGGGTATAAVAAVQELGAETVDVFVRDSARAANVRKVGRRLGIELNFRAWDDAITGLAESDVVIATLPPRGADGLSAAMMQADTRVRPGAILLDAAYDPWPSALAESWEQAGGVVVHGLQMLVFQAVEQLRLFVPEAFKHDVDEAALVRVMRESVGLPTT